MVIIIFIRKLNDNKLDGTIPTELGSLSSLQELYTLIEPIEIS